MAREIVLKKAKKLRRVGSAVVDLLFAIVLAICFYLLADSIIDNTKKYKTSLAEYQTILIDSNLYYENNNSVSLISEDYDNHLTYFFTNFTVKGINYYNALKDESDLFKYENDVYIAIGNEDDLNTFYKNVLSSITTSSNDSYSYFVEYLNKYENANELANYLNLMATLKLIIGFFLGMLIYYILIPLIKKDHGTIGKAMFHLKTYSLKGSIETSKLQIVFRELVYIFFEVLVSFYTVTIFYGVPITLLISLIMVFVTKKNQSFHDFVTQTFVVDDESVNSGTRESEKLYLTIVEDKENERK